MAHLTNVSFEFFYEIFTEDASQLFVYHGAKKSKMTKTQIKGGPALTRKRALKIAIILIIIYIIGPCLKVRSTIFIVLSTVVAEDAKHSFRSSQWKIRGRIEGRREAFSSLETLGFVRRSLGASIGKWAQKTATRRIESLRRPCRWSSPPRTHHPSLRSFKPLC